MPSSLIERCAGHWPRARARRIERLACELAVNLEPEEVEPVLARLAFERRRAPGLRAVRRAIVRELGPRRRRVPHVTEAQIRNPRRLLELFRVAVVRCSVRDSEYERMRWFVCAAYALRRGKYPAGLFADIARSERFLDVGTADDERQASSTLRSALGAEAPGAEAHGELETPPPLAFDAETLDERRAAAVVRRLFARGFRRREIIEALTGRGWTRRRTLDAIGHMKGWTQCQR